MNVRRAKQGFSVAPASKRQEYERRKREWVEKNGWTGEAEYQAALKKICEDLGL